MKFKRDLIKKDQGRKALWWNNSKHLTELINKKYIYIFNPQYNKMNCNKIKYNTKQCKEIQNKKIELNTIQNNVNKNNTKQCK